jgi:hypothetical protein
VEIMSKEEGLIIRITVASIADNKNYKICWKRYLIPIMWEGMP